jgi:biopolymer transport protein ExbD
MNLRRRRREVEDINLTPLIDVVFLLLIFFMVSTTFDRNAELAIELPEADAKLEATDEFTVEVSVDAQGRYFVNGQALVNQQTDTLKTAIEAALGDGDAPPLVISADANSPHQSVVAIMDAARQLGLARLRFAAQAGQ